MNWRINQIVFVLVSLGPEHTGHFVQPHVAAHCGGPEHTRASCGGHLWLNKVASVLGPLLFFGSQLFIAWNLYKFPKVEIFAKVCVVML